MDTIREYFNSIGEKMSRLRVESFALSLDGYGAGPNQSLENPLGVNGENATHVIIERS